MHTISGFSPANFYEKKMCADIEKEIGLFNYKLKTHLLKDGTLAVFGFFYLLTIKTYTKWTF